MNPLKKGPELKMPKLSSSQLKVPVPLANLYYDFRDRRLLPVLALVIVAIVATPILLSGGNDTESLLQPGGVATGTAGGPPVSQLTVVEATPGVRDYRKRLGGRKPADPFVQQFTGPKGGSSSESSPASSAGSSSGAGSFSEEPVTGEGSTGEAGSGGASSGGSGGSGSGATPSSPAQSELSLIEFVFDVEVSHKEDGADGKKRWSDPEVRRKLKTLAALPGEKAPAVTLGGVNLHNGMVFLLVGDETKTLDGDFTCTARTPGGLCELVELEPGPPLELTYGPEQAGYRIKVTKIDAVPAGKPGDQSLAADRRDRAAVSSLVAPSFSK